MNKEGKVRKRIYTIAAALGLAVGSFGVASAASNSQPADPGTTPQTQPEVESQEPVLNGSVQAPAEDPNAPEGTDDEASEAAEAEQLQGLATITAEEATAAAVAAVPGDVGQVELDNENGTVVYSVEITDASGTEVDVKVDAGNGTILDQQADDEGTESGEVDDDDVQNENEHEDADGADEANEAPEAGEADVTPAG